MGSASSEAVGTDAELSVVDCDLHVYPEEDDALVDRLPSRFAGKGLAYPTGNWSSPVGRFRPDAVPDAGTPGSSPEATATGYLDRFGIDRAVLTGGGANLQAAVCPDVRYAHALTTAYNDWLVDAWLDADDRYHGSISVTPLAPERAAAEIHRLADHPKMVQVVMGSGTQVPLGQEKYWPIYRAAEAEGLPVAIHAGSAGYGVSFPNSGAGYPSTYLEMRAVDPCNAMGQLLNLVLEGVPIEFPTLRIALVGAGFAWLPSMLWRVDKVWKGPSQDVPWVRDPPSEYVRESMTLVSNAFDVGTTDEHRRGLLTMSYADELLAYGSAYPHWDAVAPDTAIEGLPADHAEAVFSGNAAELYGF